MPLRYIFILCLSVFFLQSNAQTPYRCLIPGDTSFFINQTSHYLRAITIDSVASSGNDTLYYPFQTLRGPYENQVLDSNGGSWLGKNVISQNDGTWLFDTYWGDTITLKTQADLGDSWTLYNDSTSLSYTATIYATDTFSFGGVLDSIKKMHISAYNNGIINPHDSLDGLDIWLSRNHGFAKVFNLYLFPFHAPGQSINPYRADLYMDISNENPYSNWGKAYTSFDYVHYVRPTNANIYDVHPGDVFSYTLKNGNNYYNYWYTDDTVTSINLTAAGVEIFVNRGTSHYTPQGYSQGNGQTTYTCQDYDQFKNFIPEHNKPWTLAYYPVDNFQGYTNIGYHFTNIDFEPNPSGYEVNTFEPCSRLGYMDPITGIGDVLVGGCYGADPDGQWKSYMTSAFKSGHYYGLGISEVHSNSSVNVYPNPANNELHLSLPANLQNIKCHISDITGRTMLQQEISSSKNTIDVSTLAAGLYILTMNNGNEMSYQKIEIVH
ncbi:T9SS type A sorting domain-containing protein [Taibaiella soli]|uniref:Secretion system C-terminal sorting domain-containing protein n=1 Tax=Taibaiella soli TaxID=1649169 RepID=A0A2W2AH30_9BACT|nr:T9SS type A sorting domain-containing protein [Taibaiella soli]PZF74581.1 hypothetical protein DN068_03115 [Taibaiella soli]